MPRNPSSANRTRDMGSHAQSLFLGPVSSSQTSRRGSDISCVPAGRGGSVEGRRLYKALQRGLEAPSSPPAAMWFLVLCLILSLEEYGEKLKDLWKSRGPDSSLFPHKSSLSHHETRFIFQPMAFLRPRIGVLTSCGATPTPPSQSLHAA